MTCNHCGREACPTLIDQHTLADVRGAKLDCERARSARLERERDRYAEREAAFSRGLRVADAGQYRADWPGAVERCIRERDAALARAAKLATVARGLGEALEAVESAAAMTQAHEMGVLPYETSASTAALAWERADRLRAVALAAWRELEGA